MSSQGETNSPFFASSPVPVGRLYFMRSCSTSQAGFPIGIPPERYMPEHLNAVSTCCRSSSVTNLFSLVMFRNAP